MERIWALHTSCITIFTPKVFLDQTECFIFGFILVLESVVAFGGNLLLIISLFKTKQVAPRAPRRFGNPFHVRPSNILTTALASSDCLSACISMPLIIVMLLEYPKNTNCYLQFMSTFSAVIFIAASGLFTAFMNLEIYYGMDPDLTGQNKISNTGKRLFRGQNKLFWLVLGIVILSELCAFAVLTCHMEAVHKVQHLSIAILVAAAIIHSAILTNVVAFVHSVLRLRRHFEQNATITLKESRDKGKVSSGPNAPAEKENIKPINEGNGDEGQISTKLKPNRPSVKDSSDAISEENGDEDKTNRNSEPNAPPVRRSINAINKENRDENKNSKDPKPNTQAVKETSNEINDRNKDKDKKNKSREQIVLWPAEIESISAINEESKDDAKDNMNQKPNTPAAKETGNSINNDKEETKKNNQLPKEFYKARVTVALPVLTCTISYLPCNLCIIVMSVKAYLGTDFLTKEMILIFATSLVLLFAKCVLNPMIIIYRNQRCRRWIRSKCTTRREGVQQLPVMRTVQS